MRILLTYTAVGRGGDAVQLLSLADALRSDGHEVTLAGPRPITPYAFGGVDARLRGLVHRLPWWGRDVLECGLSLAAALQAERTASGQPVDLLVHRAGVYDLGMARVARRLDVPLVLYLDGDVESERAFLGRPYWRGLHRYAMRALGRAAATIVTPSRAVAGYYARLGLPAEKIVVHHNGVLARHLAFGLTRAETRPPFGALGTCTLGFVGSLSRWHRLELLLEALRLLQHGQTGDGHVRGDRRSPVGPRYRLLVVGRGAEYERLQAHAEALGLDGAVEWRGGLSHDAAVEAMLEFDVAVLPHTLQTGTPMKLAEYAAMARPIIAPDYPNIRDMFDADREIALVPVGDPAAIAAAVRALEARPARARAMGRAAQLRVAGRTWESMVQHLVSEALAPAQEPAAHPAGPGRGPDPDEPARQNRGDPILSRSP